MPLFLVWLVHTNAIKYALPIGNAAPIYTAQSALRNLCAEPPNLQRQKKATFTC